MRRTALALSCLLAALFLAAPIALAQEMSATGHAVYVPKDHSKVELPNGTYAVEQMSEGYVITDDPDSSFNLVAQDCAGTNIVDADGTTLRASGYCSGRDQEGDMYWFHYWNGPEGNEWTLIGGTGKWEGITGGGTSEPIAADAGGTFAVRWEGSWTTE